MQEKKGTKHSEGTTHRIQMQYSGNKITTGRDLWRKLCVWQEFTKGMRKAHHKGQKTGLLLLNLTTEGRDSRGTVRLYQEFTRAMDTQRRDRRKKARASQCRASCTR